MYNKIIIYLIRRWRSRGGEEYDLFDYDHNTAYSHILHK